MPMAQGTRANYTGDALEQVIHSTLERKGYTFVPKREFDKARSLDQPVFTTQFPIGRGIYGTELRCDFILFDPHKHPDCLVIESKWQESGGSVDEKFPYLVHNIQQKYPCAAIVVVDGGGAKPGAVAWLRSQEDKRLVHVFSMMEFQRWANGDSL